MSTSHPTDDDNPVWTREDFARALPPDALPPHVLAAFPKTAERIGIKKLAPAGSLMAALTAQNSGARMHKLAA